MTARSPGLVPVRMQPQWNTQVNFNLKTVFPPTLHCLLTDLVFTHAVVWLEYSWFDKTVLNPLHLFFDRLVAHRPCLPCHRGLSWCNSLLLLLHSHIWGSVRLGVSGWWSLWKRQAVRKPRGDPETKEKADEWVERLKMRHPKKAEKRAGRVVDSGED